MHEMQSGDNGWQISGAIILFIYLFILNLIKIDAREIQCDTHSRQHIHSSWIVFGSIRASQCASKVESTAEIIWIRDKINSEIDTSVCLIILSLSHSARRGFLGAAEPPDSVLLAD